MLILKISRQNGILEKKADEKGRMSFYPLIRVQNRQNRQNRQIYTKNSPDFNVKRLFLLDKNRCIVL